MHPLPPRWFRSALFGVLLLAAGSLTAEAQVYWDINGAAAGAGSSAPAGDWNSTAANWNSAADGTGATSGYTQGVAVFAAGDDATGDYTVTLTEGVTVDGLTYEDGVFSTLTLAEGTAGKLWIGGAAPLDEYTPKEVDISVVANATLNLATPVEVVTPGSGWPAPLLAKTGEGALGFYDRTTLTGWDLQLNDGQTIFGSGAVVTVNQFHVSESINQTATARIEDGAQVTASTATISNGVDPTYSGATNNTQGTLTIDGLGSKLTVTGFSFTVGNAGSGQLKLINGGQLRTQGGAMLGGYSGGSGGVSVTGAGSLWTHGTDGSGQNTISIGGEYSSGYGQLSVTNGGRVVTDGITLYSSSIVVGSGGRVDLLGPVDYEFAPLPSLVVNSPGMLMLQDGAVLGLTLRDPATPLVQILDEGTLMMSGYVTVDLVAGSGFRVGSYTLFDIASGATVYAGENNTTADLLGFLTLGTTPAGYAFALGADGSNIALTVSAVPEPATVGLLMGLLILGWVWVRRGRVADVI